MVIKLGPAPDSLEVTLVRGGTWWGELTQQVSRTDPTPLPFADGVTVELHVGDEVWTATINGADATWLKTTADVTTAVDSRNRHAELWQVTDTERIPWGLGTVTVRG